MVFAKKWEITVEDGFKLREGIGDTPVNLDHTAAGENYEQTDMYPGFAKDAKAEGFKEIY